MQHVLAKDDRGNVYFRDGEKLLVDIKKLEITKQIGILSSNINKGSTTLTLTRTAAEWSQLGVFVSAAIFTYIKIDYIAVYDPETKKMLVTEVGADLAGHCTYFIPDNGYEDQIILHQTRFKEFIAR